MYILKGYFQCSLGCKSTYENKEGAYNHRMRHCPIRFAPQNGLVAENYNEAGPSETNVNVPPNHNRTTSAFSTPPRISKGRICKKNRRESITFKQKKL